MRNENVHRMAWRGMFANDVKNKHRMAAVGMFWMFAEEKTFSVCSTERKKAVALRQPEHEYQQIVSTTEAKMNALVKKHGY